MEEFRDKENEEQKDDDIYEETVAVAFKNISAHLVELIDEAPASVIQTEEDIEMAHDTQFVTGFHQVEQLIFGRHEEGCMDNKVFGYLLGWNAMLSKIEQGRIKSQLSAQTQYSRVLASLTEHLESNAAVYQQLLVAIVPYLPRMNKGLQNSYNSDLAAFAPEYCDINSERSSRLFCLQTLINFMKSFPSLGRKFYQDCDKQILDIVLPYIKQVVSPAILENEIKKIEMSQLELGADSDLSFVLFKSTKEVIATYNKITDISVQLKLKIPADYPLKSVVVDIGD